MIRGLIFDLDGTLGDTLPVCFRAFSAVLGRRLGRSFDSAEIHAMFGPSEEGILARHFPEDADGALEEYLREYALAHEACPEPFGGIREALEIARLRGVRLAVVTGKGPRSARISLSALRLAEYFPVVEAGSPDGGVKPAAMRRVLRGWGLAPVQVASIGDSPSDVKSAKQVSVRSLAAAWAPGARPDLLEACLPDRLFRDVPAFRRWLEEAVGPLKR